jgi:Flp pilus assembly protein TadG
MAAARSLYQRAGSKPGTTMAEFGLIAVPCLTLLFAIMSFAMALYCYDFVGYSARQATRYAMVHGSTASKVASSDDVKNYVNGLVVGVLDTKSLTVTTTWLPNNNRGSVVTVTVGYTFKPLTHLVSRMNITLSKTSAMVISQ